MQKFEKIGVLGGGAWGTALAHSACLAGRSVTLWTREPDIAAAINTAHENTTFLPGISIHPSLKATSNLEEMANNDAILLVVPAQFVRPVTETLAKHIAKSTPLIICAKGIETSSSKLMSEVIEDTIPDATLAVLSGPSFASDVAKGLPTAVTLATKDEELGKALAASLNHSALRPYWTNDLIGVQIGGAVKNVLAIAAGIVMGKELGASAHASLITRGFAELNRFAIHQGADKHTLQGLSGLGDLILTCSSPQSRNYSLGAALGQGQSLDDILKQRRSVSEGVYTAEAVAKLAKEQGIAMPISQAVAKIVKGDISIDDAIATLLSRPLKAETDAEISH